MQKLIKWLVPLLCILAAALLFLLPSGSSEEKEMQERGLQVQRIEDPEGPVAETVVVSPEAIPRTIEERLQAPAIALLPNRTGYPEMQGEVPISSTEKSKIKQAAEKFLKTWETFSPGDRNYSQLLKKMIVTDSSTRVASREDATDPPGVCPDAGCRSGSEWYDPPRFSDSAFVVDQDDQRIFLVAYGAVSYKRDGLQESSAQRSYGIVMRKEGGLWLVERASAESLR